MLVSTRFFGIICLLILGCLCSAEAQQLAHKYQPQLPQIKIKKALSPITLDGNLTESDWAAAEKTTPFLESSPYDTGYAQSKTVLSLTFDDENIYIGATCFQKREKYVVVSLKRDFAPGTTDLLGILFDTFGDKQNAFSFAVSPLGVQREGLIANGNEFSSDWDNRWRTKVVNASDFWTVEIAIPFKTIRYKPESSTWNINFLRFDQSVPVAERSTWSFLPRFSNGNNVAFSGQLVWETPPPKAGANIALVPYVLGEVQQQNVPVKNRDEGFGVGLDAKIALGSAMALDLTLNPDFAQVEADKQVTDLSRFELSFPEKRQFFLENADLFGNFGFGNINPLFSRRIGLALDSANNSVRVPILGGLRLTGKLDKSWRLGFMDIQTKGESALKLPATNFMATALQRKVFSRSLISMIVVNKQNFGVDSLGKTIWEAQSNGFNRLVGLDYTLASKDGKWQGKAFYHRSWKPKTLNDPFATAANIRYSSNRFYFYTGIEKVGEGFSADVGFVPRNNYYRAEPFFRFIFYPKSGRVNTWNVGTDGDIRFRITDNKRTDWDFSPLIFNITFQNNARVNFTPLRFDYIYLTGDFDPTKTDGKKLLAGTQYTYPSARANFQSDTRKAFSYAISSRFGNYFNGKIVETTLNAAYRYQPYGVLALDISYNNIQLPDGYKSAQLWVISPRADVSFTRNIFFTTLVQFNNQTNNLNLNARFQWRFAPVSDLFLVYTQNTFATDDALRGHEAYESKNRALVLKLNYWLNL
jgi:hypothetical protein